MYHEYPYTTYYHDIDRLCGACHACGYRLDIQGDYLRLVKKDGSVVSSVQITYADKAAHDVDGKAIEAYIFDVSEDGTHIVFAKGDGTYKTITVPYSEKAAKDLQGKDLLNYSYALSISGDKLRITKGDGSVYEITIPYAVQASETVDGKAIDTFAASLEVDGNELVLRDAKGRQLNRITVEYAESAGLAEEANHALDADHADEADHAKEADAADYATLSTDSTNAVESVTIVGDTMVFSTYGGQTFTITCPYSVKAQKDDAGNTIKTTYVANIAQNSTTGEISFYDGTGNVITTLTPTASIASYDSYSNLIADYIKTLVVSQDSDYVTVTHGNGVVDSIKIDYSNRAWKDTNDNVIKNTYVKSMECIEDVDDGHYKLVAYNGDTPQAELFRFEVYAYAAQCDVNGKALTSYVADLDITNNNIVVKDGESNVLETLALPGYYLDTNDTQIELHRESETISNLNVPTVQVNISSSISPWDFNNTSFTSSAVSCNMSSLQVLSGLTDNACVWVSYGGHPYIATVKSQTQSGNLTTIFESAVENSKVWQITLVTSQLGAFISCKGNVIDLSSGGGGGGSVSILNLTDGQGNPARFDNAQQAGTVQLHLSGTAQDFSHVSALLQSGSVIIKDSASSFSTIECTNSSSLSLIVPCFNGNSFTRLKLEHQWSGNYRVSAVQ